MPNSPTLTEQHPLPPPLTRANSVVSLYQSCLNLMERLAGVPDFEQYLDPEFLQNIQAGVSTLTSPNDPVSQLWTLFRLGAPLACIFNGLRPKEPLKINNKDTNLTNINACKIPVFRFLVACRQELQFKDEDLFTISELYQDDTNGFVKVIKTISMVLDRMETQGLLHARQFKCNSDPVRPTDNRAKVVNEILETERCYVQDLENLQAYMRALQSDGSIISAETIHLIFGNLNVLVDFQRRFLIAIEANAALAPQDQNFGQVFSQHEEAFAVYEPFCANVKAASALVVHENEKLQRMNHLLDAQHGINSNLIKPVQRICKYPLFMHELIKLTDPDHPYYSNLLEGQNAIKRVAEKINETNRRQDNQETAKALQHMVAWKDGELVSDFGALLLHDTLLNPRGPPDKALDVYLFEKILVCCQSMVIRRRQPKTLVRGAKPKPTLHLNGRIYINNIKSILPVSSAGSYVLHVVWNVAAEEFELRCRNEDQLKKWHSVLDKLVTEANTERSNTVTMNNYVETSTPSYESSFFHDDDDYLEDELEGDDDEYDEPRGFRSYSLPFGLSSQANGQGNRSRIKTEEGSVPPSNARTGSNGSGMTLPPLPRTASSASTTMGVVSPGEYPYSPPASYPASPTASNPRGSGSSGSWQRRSNGDGHSPLNDTTSSFLGSEEHSQPMIRNASAGYLYNTTPPAVPPVPPVPGPLRVRALSSSNIHASTNVLPTWSDMPELPTHHQKFSSGSGANSPTTPYPSNAYPTVHAVPSALSIPDSARMLRQHSSCSSLSTNGAPQLRIKVNFQEDSYLIVVPMQIKYSELIERVEKKIRLCGSRRSETHPLRLRYKDEDNDYIIMKDDDDISLAFESCFTDGIMNLHVS
ncbi:hypothetical protein BX616_002666 [Lobosporangium transversale]|uniref:Uncharacterized protein n=1 Tax=Lobosporangium transversale TaxID=64571 RepID=A0A1Y2GCA2_9FUNG|nr:hypothetical protein BCR41DRAFT_172538 [Lobosporangium transversale]KAF9916836.1 hypothetical protein BX616_002666 [Lobosporangium transversale]ORZ05872.1 hypothetical protein BCR41DRAFT_172538 [Lobosporangium transversale]|eukprot:XP_021877253.1 hypothetical protein BCR41DRAFT_172538 [Lobosporangium transversale]